MFVVGEDWYFCSHRMALAKAAAGNGFEVSVATPVSRYRDTIVREGFHLYPITIERTGKNPFQDLRTIAELVGLYRRERPDIVHHVAIKPVLYGSMAAMLAGVPGVVNAVAGLGYVFTGANWKLAPLRMAVRLGFRMAFAGDRRRLILQNPDDVVALRDLVPSGNVRLIRGAGVDTAVFAPSPEPQGPPIIVLASRMIWDKGIAQFVKAARRLKADGRDARFVLVGETDARNPAAVPPEQIRKWVKEGLIESWGRREDMPQVFRQSCLVCLPSYYREGLPKVLLEAAASGRPIITTDSPGCREIVRSGENGLLVPVKDVDALCAAIASLLDAPALRDRMGKRGREIVMAEFSDEIVIKKTLAVYEELLRSH